MLKRLQNWREVPVDAVVLSLYHLQAFYHNEIQRGFSGLGTYTLSAELVAATRSPDEICAILTYSPEDIVSRIKEGLDLVPPTDNDVGSSSLSAFPSSESLVTRTSRARLVQVYILINMYKISMHLNSNLRSIIENGCISHNHKLGVFTVVGTSGNPHAVKLFPKESCTCPSTSQCYHILAARISVGLEPTTSQKKINLTQLRQKTRSRRDKKSGRKAPRPGDYEVIPAPDAKSLVSYYCHCVAMCTPSVSTGYLACKY